ncbi:MerR family transcriptional regulator [Robertmurraya kyonggiensis]|uniref:MerR family transcriptional regulator n=1 Tax=Robertmurraya kyonggiensis TaxID=1037680 RepID=A0A4U1D9C3_9BACI|nr:MerR family transcriptional regulator [Robertmurraya kyonggiensis]TKC18117.1 MerR family transcriptional regulator [Robertmurraya kyonggiensis]
MRWYDGAVYRIGELANLANLSKRTIDYYTSIGLLKAQRSKSNYRIYTHQDLEDLKFIEECKNLHIPLEEIKRKLEMKKLKEVHEGELKKHIQSVTQQMKQLQTDLNVLIPLFESLESGQVESYSKLLNTESEVLLKSLSELTS